MSETKPHATKICLNGWWDFLPCYSASLTPSVPESGWLEKQYLVPSFWTKPTSAVRRKGEATYAACDDPRIFDGDDVEFLFDAFGYPSAWSRTRSAWIRRSYTIDAVDPTARYHLVFEALMPRARLFVNGHSVCTHIHPTLPLDADVTPWLRPGANEVAVLIEDYDRDDRGRAVVPTGNTIPCDHSGIWQDVWLETRADVTISDVAIRTSTRTRTLTVMIDVTNTSDRSRHISLVADVRDWVRGIDPALAPTVLELPLVELDVAPSITVPTTIEIPWASATWWYPEAPKLYWLHTVLLDAHQNGTAHQNGLLLETSNERFGFREVWIEGLDILLNGNPVHLFSDWGHKWTPYYITEGWIRQWFGMIRDANMNHSRLHTHPHPTIVLDLADEEGILITGEAGLHGSGGDQGAEAPAYWMAAIDHVRRFVKRDKNHPSLILWSVGNEMRWNTKGEGDSLETKMVQEELPKLRALFNALDPTRPAYHEGDTSLWNERTQPIISRHYGKECAGIGWWDGAQPLHSGEMALYHYAGPNNTLHLGSDSVYASFDRIDACAAQDAAWIIETGRSLGVSCFGPWNLSCLENVRPEPEDVALTYDDYEAPGMKPLKVPAHASEFSFWQSGKGYAPNTSFAIQADAFRPLAVIDCCLRSGYYAGQTFRRELFVANDTTRDIAGQLTATLSRADQTVVSVTHSISVARGRVASCVVEAQTSPDLEAGACTYTVRFEADGRVLDEWQRPIQIGTTQRGTDLPRAKIAVFGPGSLDRSLATLASDYTYVDDLEPTTLSGVKVLIMERNTVRPGSRQNQHVQAFVRGGGRLIVMEQTACLFPALELVEKPVLGAFARAYGHPVLHGISENDLVAWGDDPYPLLANGAYVAIRMYRKDDGRSMLPLLDSGEGGFGSGDLSLTPLFEARDGSGLILACQMRLTEKLAQIPAAQTLFANILRRAIAYEPITAPNLLLPVAGERVDALQHLANVARSGAVVVVENATPEALKAWSDALGLHLIPRDVGDVYQVVRTGDHPLLSGVSNEDLCGIETFSYTPASADNFIVGRTFLAPVPGLESLLETPRDSCLRELMVDGGRTEALRAYTLTHCLLGERPTPAVALGRVRLNEGAVIFNQFAPPVEKRARFARLRNRLWANLGQPCAGGLLEGDAVPTARQTSAGYPEHLYVLDAATDEAARVEMLERCAPTLERMVATPILAVGTAWQQTNTPDGIVRADGLDPIRDVYLYHTIWSPSPRKNTATNLDVPNPEALTFLDLEGEGAVELAVNGRILGQVTLEQGAAAFSDIALEMGGNHVLLRWVPIDQSSTLKMRWRNIMRQPETGLQFGSAGSSD